MKIILASSSPRRQELLRQIGLAFTVREADFSEKEESFSGVGDMAVFNACGKASAVNADDGDFVIAADTVVSLDGVVMGKPKDEEDARRMLALLSGKVHEVYTGVCVRHNGENHQAVEMTKVKMRKLPEKDIRAYVATKEPLDKAGAYGIQGKGALLVEWINGCYYNVVGLPLVCLMGLLEKAGFDFEY